MSKSQKGLTLEEIYDSINDLSNMEAFKDVGRLRTDCKKEYENKYNFWISTNNGKLLNGYDDKDDNNIKGKALEDLVRVLFKSTGGFFNILTNVGTSTNEIDLILTLNHSGKLIRNLFRLDYTDILCECKNYNKRVGVTMTGKFFSLMQLSHRKIGVLFSYHGFSGRSEWSSSKGFAKKAFMLKENLDCKFYLLDFNKDDFYSILNGASIFSILDNKCLSLELDTNIAQHISKHPCEDELLEVLKNT